MSDGDLLERLAAQEHERWSRWMKYLFSRCQRHSEAGVVIPADLVERWTRQSETPYADLSEKEKESDRKEARATLATMGRQT